MSGTVVVVSGGPAPVGGAARGLPADAFVIAADSGLDHARELGLRVDLVVGDLDSVSPTGLADAEDQGIAIEAHPAAKDQTDLELALDRALERHPERIVVVGPDGGRLDHLVAGAMVLAADRYAEVATIEARLGPATVTVVRRAARLHGEPGDRLTLVPVGGTAEGVTTEGLVYPLADEDLAPGTTRGVSNEFVAETARVTVRQGVLLAIQPGPSARR